MPPGASERSPQATHGSAGSPAVTGSACQSGDSSTIGVGGANGRWPLPSACMTQVSELALNPVPTARVYAISRPSGDQAGPSSWGSGSSRR
jgi:hypothetical protein